MSEQSRETIEKRNEPTSIRSADPPPIRQTGAAPEKQKPTGRRKILLGAAGVLILAGALWFGIPWVQTTLNTVSTDDAYVNGHVTFVAARVKGQVSRVLVDDNYRVKKGDLLVQLDKEPYQVQVAIKKAAVEVAETDFAAAQAQVRSLVGMARAYRFRLEHTIEDVHSQIANLRANVANYESR